MNTCKLFNLTHKLRRNKKMVQLFPVRIQWAYSQSGMLVNSQNNNQSYPTRQVYLHSYEQGLFALLSAFHNWLNDKIAQKLEVQALSETDILKWCQTQDLTNCFYPFQCLTIFPDASYPPPVALFSNGSFSLLLWHHLTHIKKVFPLKSSVI